MREVTAAFAAVALVITLAGCATAPPDESALASDILSSATPTEASVAPPPEASVAPLPSSSAEPSVGPSSATPLASIRRGPVRAHIEAVRETDGAVFDVKVDAPRAVEGDPLVTADCGEADPDHGLSVVVQDLAVEDGVATATLGVPDEVQEPGSYDGVVTFLDTDGEAVRGAGTVVVGASLDSGTFDVSDPESGDRLVGVWECRAL